MPSCESVWDAGVSKAGTTSNSPRITPKGINTLWIPPISVSVTHRAFERQRKESLLMLCWRVCVVGVLSTGYLVRGTGSWRRPAVAYWLIPRANSHPSHPVVATRTVANPTCNQKTISINRLSHLLPLRKVQTLNERNRWHA